MGLSLSPPISAEPMRKVKKWLSIGAVVSMPAWPVIGILTSDRGLWHHINTVAGMVHSIAEYGVMATLFPALFFLAMAVIGLLAGCEFVSKVGPRFLNDLPCAALFFLGFILGLLLMIIGVFSIFLMLAAAILGLDELWFRTKITLETAKEAPWPVGLLLICFLVAPIIAVIVVYILFKMALAAIF